MERARVPPSHKGDTLQVVTLATDRKSDDIIARRYFFDNPFTLFIPGSINQMLFVRASKAYTCEFVALMYPHCDKLDLLCCVNIMSTAWDTFNFCSLDFHVSSACAIIEFEADPN